MSIVMSSVTPFKSSALPSLSGTSCQDRAGSNGPGHKPLDSPLPPQALRHKPTTEIMIAIRLILAIALLTLLSVTVVMAVVAKMMIMMMIITTSLLAMLIPLLLPLLLVFVLLALLLSSL